MAKGFTFSEEFARRILLVVRWVERQRAGGTRPQGFVERADPFERCKLSATLNKGGSATADLYTGSASAGWTITTDEITVYEDDMIAAGESVASGKDILVMWMHGEWVLFDVPCADIA